MQKREIPIVFYTLVVAMIVATVTCIALNAKLFFGNNEDLLAHCAPWRCVGGCGAGGAGGTSADIKWIGEGVRGGLVDIEAMNSSTVGENYRYDQLKLRVSGKPTWTTGIGFSVPIVSKTGSLQPQTNYDDKTEISGGVADLMLDFSKNFGMEGEYSLMINCVLPTGQYDIKRGKENEMLYLPRELQKGGGVFQASLGLSKTIDAPQGLWMFEGYYTHPFALNFYGKNQFVNNRPDQFSAVNSRWDLLSDAEKKRFAYYVKPYGENDLGAYTPPSIMAAAYYGYRGQKHYVHSFGLKASVPIGVAWIPAYSASTYDPRPDPNHKAWTMTLHYGLEFSKPQYPFYLSVNKIIADRPEINPSDPYDERPLARWNGPDIGDMINNNWTIAFGIKSTMF